MAVRIIKNSTSQEYTLSDLGDLKIPANGAVDIGGDENKLIQLATSADLISLLSQNKDTIIVNDGSKDYDYVDGLDLMMRVTYPSKPTEVDSQGRWVVKTDSRRKDYDVVFQGSGDDIVNNSIGTGTDFIFDFSDTSSGMINAPSGFLRKQIKWNFIDLVYMKGGVLNYYDMPKGSYIDFYLASPTGYPYSVKLIDSSGDVSRETRLASSEIKWMHWVIKHWSEGTGSSSIVNETAVDVPSYPFMIFIAEITVPAENSSSAHGNWILNFYRNRTMVLS